MTINRLSTIPTHTQTTSSAATRADLPQLRFPLLVLICLVIVVTGIGYSVYGKMKQEEAQKIRENLSAVANLKVGQIAGWLRDNMNIAGTASKGSALASLAAQSAEQDTRSEQLARTIRERLKFVKQRQSYSTLALLDAAGNLFQSTDDGLNALSAERDLIRQALEHKQPALGEMHRETRPNGTSYVNLAIAVPLFASDADETVAGVLWIGLDASKFLFPMIQTWPTSSETAETVLVRRDGDDVIFLNELRHRKGEPLGFHIPADHPTVLAAQAVRGATGFISGTDYRGEPVIGYVSKVPGTAWLMIAKMDEQEVYAPIRRLAFTLFLISFVVLAAASLSLFFWWRQRMEQYRAARLEAELEQQFLSQKYQSLSKYANDILLLMDEAGNLVEANERAEKAYGYPREELLGKNIRQLCKPDELAAQERQFATVKEGERIVFENVHVRSDGTQFPVEVSSSAIRTDEGIFIQSIIRDITERKEAQDRERLVTNIYRALSATNEAIIHAESEEKLLPVVCKIAVEYGGMLMAWVGVPNNKHRFVPVASFGGAIQYLNEVFISSSAAEPSGQGPSGIAYREGRPVVANDYIRDDMTMPWAEKARQFGIRSAAAFPVKRTGKPYALLAVYSKHAHEFDEKIVQLLEEMAANISFALDNLDLEASRNQAEKALRESEALFRQLADAMPQMVWTAHPDGTADYYNERHLEYLSFFQRDDGKFGWAPVFHPDDFAATKHAWEHAVRTEEMYQIEHRVQRSDLSYRWHISRSVPMRNEQGKIVKWFGTITDIHELKKAQNAAQQNEERMRLAQQVARIGSFEWNLRTNEIIWSPEIEALYGVEPGGFARTNDAWLERIHPDDAQLAKQFVQNALTTGGLESEWRAVWPDGTTRWLACRMQIIRDETGQPLRMVGINMDITAIKTTEEALKESEEKLRISFANAAIGFAMTTPEGRFTDANPAYLELTGYDIDELREQEIPQMMHPEDLVENMTLIERVLAGDIPDFVIENRYVRKNGQAVWVRKSVTLVRSAEGMPRWLIALVEDITERMRAEEELKLAATVYTDSSEAMMIADADGNIIAVNPAFEQITGFTSGDALGKNTRILKSGHHDALFYQNMWAAILSTGRWKGELWSKKKNGELFAAQLTVNTIRNEDGAAYRYVGLMSDITEKKQNEDLIWSQANFDALTALPNRRLFRDRLQHEIHNAQRNNLPLALMLLDLDGFKDVNDTLGHDMGDILLKTAAERLSGCVRKTDTVARLGGDEFTVILAELHDSDSVNRIARHMLRSLSEPIQLGNEVAYVSASIGITLYPNDGENIETLIKNADQAMYSAKQTGRNRYSYFTPSMQESVLLRMRLVNDLRTALERNQFEIVYQPIVELATGEILKAEALIRWRHPTKGVINPIEFISAAEDTGMISSFGNWMFHEAAKQAAIWREKYHPGFQISVNISPVQFKNDGIDPSVWFKHLRELGLPGQGIVVEITEGLLLEASEKVTDQLLMLRDAGIEVALDDFGTGYSSLAYLKRFDIDYVKIDRTFVQNLAADSNDMVLCEAMIAMAHKLDLKVIAEGVETRQQHELLSNGECDFAQGYIFSRPMPKDDFEKLLISNPFSHQESFNI